MHEAESARQVGENVGRFRLERLLGEGRLTQVYVGRAADGSAVAIKLLRSALGGRDDMRERFLREGYMANGIAHPGAVRALEHGQSDPVFLAMDLMAGETLGDRVRRHGTLPVSELLDVADQALDTLIAAHAKGIFHRHLKPTDLFVTTSGQIKILDFGLAELAETVTRHGQDGSHVALESLRYKAPEQASGRHADIDGTVDLFALGATLFRILSGRSVHVADTEAELLVELASTPAPALSTFVPQISPDVARIVDRSLSFSRAARYPDARTMQADVRAARSGVLRFSERDHRTRGPAERAERGLQQTAPLTARQLDRSQVAPAVSLAETFPSAVSREPRGRREPRAGDLRVPAASNDDIRPAPSSPVSGGPWALQHTLGKTYPSGGSHAPAAESAPQVPRSARSGQATSLGSLEAAVAPTDALLQPTKTRHSALASGNPGSQVRTRIPWRPLVVVGVALLVLAALSALGLMLVRG